MLRTLRNLGRLARIALTLMRYDALTAFSHAGLPPALLWFANRLPAGRGVGRPGQRLAAAFTTLGPTFIKLGQALSIRADIVGEEVAADLSELQDKLPPFPAAQARATVAAELGQPLAALFNSFDDVPVAAASIAQVHFAVTSDGREVAVKILRPGVEAQFARDLDLFLWIAERILTMEFVRGTKIDAQPAERRKPLAATVRGVMMKMCFEDGFLHADMHPGNMVVDEQGRLVLFDVGLAKLLHESVLEQFIDMGKCLSMGTPDDLVDHLKRFHTYIDGVHWDELRSALEEFALKFRARDAATLEYGQMFNELFAIGRRFHVRPVPDLTLVLVAMVTSQGIGSMLDPGVNVFSEVARYLVPILMKRNQAVPASAPAVA
jgi:predicted unusual protein kinase regulating ubiquinone biosynthesis (AarF/ABC1/UbiB family)